MKTTTNCTKSQTRRGATAVEFALVGPLFLFLIMACFEFCWLGILLNSTEQAAFHAARATMVPNSTEGQTHEEVKRILGLIGVSGYTVTINDGQGIRADSAEVKVRIAVPLKGNSFLVTAFLKPDAEIKVVARVATERS